MQGDLLPIVIGSIVGGLFGGILSIVILWVMSNKAQRTYPALSIPVPNGARYSPDFELWVQLNKYRRTEENCYTKGRGMLTSSTEIRFHGNEMEIVEVVNFLFAKRRFAINAPVMFGKPVRRHKIKQINKLLERAAKSEDASVKGKLFSSAANIVSGMRAIQNTPLAVSAPVANPPYSGHYGAHDGPDEYGCARHRQST